MVLACWQRNIVNNQGDVQPGALVTVTLEGGGLATLYDNRAGTGMPIANPVTADSNGFVQFFSASGAYRIEATKGAFNITWRYVPMGTAAEFDMDAGAAGYHVKYLSATGIEASASVWEHSDGRVAIGTTSPASSTAVTIEADGASNNQLILRDTGLSGMYVKQTTAGSIEIVLVDAGSNILIQATGMVRLAADSGSKEARVTSTGLGVGGSPSFSLDVMETSAEVVGRFNTGGAAVNAAVQLTNGTKSWRVVNSGSQGGTFLAYDVTHNKVPFTIEPNTGDNLLYLDSNYRVGLGTNTPATLFHLYHAVQASMTFESPTQAQWAIVSPANFLYFQDSTSPTDNKTFRVASGFGAGFWTLQALNDSFSLQESLITVTGMSTLNVEIGNDAGTVQLMQDASWQFSRNGNARILSWASNDYNYYDQSSNVWYWYVGGTASAQLGLLDLRKYGADGSIIMEMTNSARFTNYVTDGGTNQKYVELIQTDTNGFSLRTVNDAYSDTDSAIEFSRQTNSHDISVLAILGGANGGKVAFGTTTSATISGLGFKEVSYSGGTQSGSGTYTPDAANGNKQHITNGGAFTLAPPSASSTIEVEITNNGSAGSITTSGFTKVVGDSFTTTNGNKFACLVSKTQNYSYLIVTALQ